METAPNNDNLPACDGGKRVTRRQFLLGGLAIGGALWCASWLLPRHRVAASPRKPRRGGLSDKLAVARGDDPRLITRQAVDALGGMAKLVRPGDVVVIKPNMAWDSPPELAANTNPIVVAALVEMCVEAGAGVVKVLDHTASANPRTSYESSGIMAAASAAGGSVRFVDKLRFTSVEIPEGPSGRALDRWDFYDDILAADVLINVPCAKHHSTSRLTMGLKNVFGMVGLDRGRLHRNIHKNIADLNKVVRADLTVLDAYRRLVRNGPTGGRPDDVDDSQQTARRVIACTDPVAADAYGAGLFGMTPQEVGFIVECEKAGLGRADYAGRIVESKSP